MTIFDYLVIFVLASSIIIGTLRGLVKEILSLAGWIVAFVVANAYGPWLAAMLLHWTQAHDHIKEWQ